MRFKLIVVAALAASWIAVAGAELSAESAAPAARDNVKGFEVEVREIEGKVRRRMTGSSWRPGCPVDREDLRLIRATHWDWGGHKDLGSIVVHEKEAGEIVRVFRSLFRQRFPIRRMELIDRFGADDHRSMNADNTSGFNCRYVNGTTTWSQHAYGRAIDLNPIENPYVTPSGFVSPPAGEPYADRSRDSKGMVHRGDAAYRAFSQEGWKWGGNWSGSKDYQHFSENGR